MRRIPLFVLGVALVGLAGCGPRVLHETTVDLKPGEIKGPVLQDLKKDHKVRVEVSSPGVPVDVYLVLEKDEQTALVSVPNGQAPPNALVSRTKTEGETLEVTMPEATGLAILVHNPLANRKDTSAKVKALRP